MLISGGSTALTRSPISVYRSGLPSSVSVRSIAPSRRSCAVSRDSAFSVTVSRPLSSMSTPRTKRSRSSISSRGQSRFAAAASASVRASRSAPRSVSRLLCAAPKLRITSESSGLSDFLALCRLPNTARINLAYAPIIYALSSCPANAVLKSFSSIVQPSRSEKSVR